MDVSLKNWINSAKNRHYWKVHINAGLNPGFRDTYIYIYIYMCVCVCVYRHQKTI